MKCKNKNCPFEALPKFNFCRRHRVPNGSTHKIVRRRAFRRYVMRSRVKSFSKIIQCLSLVVNADPTVVHSTTNVSKKIPFSINESGSISDLTSENLDFSQLVKVTSTPKKE